MKDRKRSLRRLRNRNSDKSKGPRGGAALFPPLKGRRSDGENDLYRCISIVVPDVKGLRRDSYAVALTESEGAGIDFQIH